MTLILELVFPVAGAELRSDHAYPLYAALSRLVPAFHGADSGVRFGPIGGATSAAGRLQLTAHSYLPVRLPQNAVKLALPLAGKKLIVGDAAVRLGVPSVRTLIPSPSLFARVVTFKNADTPEQILTKSRGKLAELGIAGEPQLPIHLAGERAGERLRRVVRVKGVKVVGYALIVAELSAADSLKLQESGLGGRTRMGCGFFVPMKEAK